MIYCDKCKNEAVARVQTAIGSTSVRSEVVACVEFNSGRLDAFDLCEGCQNELKETLQSTLKKFLGE